MSKSEIKDLKIKDKAKREQVMLLEQKLANNFYFTLEQLREISTDEFKQLMPLIPDFLIEPL